ncbi:hypothetical protein [Sphaerisporangium aureirubrum]|uniref:Integral membrane protein n=1 Tax=Sphaerisporangium aureirubrum TaxID=1544736 RepID=A0ABW1NAH7_9ACTN
MRMGELARHGWVVGAVVVLCCLDWVLLVAAGFVIDRAVGRGVLCDGATVLCSGSDPTYEQWLAEIRFRCRVAYTSYGVVAVVLVTTLVIAWRRGRKGIVVMQGVVLAWVVMLVVLWQPYPGVP